MVATGVTGKVYRRFVVLAAVLAALGLVRSASAGQLPVDVGPVVLSARWVTAPVRVGTDEVLRVRSVDVDDVITEVDVSWGDGVVSFADPVCLKPGQIATVRLHHTYQDAGTYTVRVTAISSPRCGVAGTQDSPDYPVITRVR
jgi:hypothetical protein